MSRRIVKVQYREKGSGRSAAITLPLDIYDSWGRPLFVSLEEVGGAVVVRPVRLITYASIEPDLEMRDYGTLERLERSAESEEAVSISLLPGRIRGDSQAYGEPVVGLVELGPPTRVIVKYGRATRAYRVVEELDWVPEQAYTTIVEEMAGQPPDKRLQDYPKRPSRILVKKAGPYLIVEPFYD